MDQKSDQTTFVYTTYIHATPERVWQGLTDPTFTTRYWRHPVPAGFTLFGLAEILDLRFGLREGRARDQRPRTGDPRV